MPADSPKKPWSAGGLGAFSAGAAGVAVMPIFYPFARLFDSKAGGDTPVGLMTELILGLVGGMAVIPLTAGLGALVGRRIGIRPMTVGLVAALVLFAIGAAVACFAILNTGFRDRDGSMAMLYFVGSMGCLVAIVSVAIYEATRRSSTRVAAT